MDNNSRPHLLFYHHPLVLVPNNIYFYHLLVTSALPLPSHWYFTSSKHLFTLTHVEYHSYSLGLVFYFSFGLIFLSTESLSNRPRRVGPIPTYLQRADCPKVQYFLKIISLQWAQPQALRTNTQAAKHFINHFPYSYITKSHFLF